MVAILKLHSSDVTVSHQACMAVAGLARQNLENSTKLGSYVLTFILKRKESVKYFSVFLFSFLKSEIFLLSNKDIYTKL